MLALKRAISRIVDGSGRHPAVVLLVALAVVASSWFYAATHFQVSSDLLELLPRDSPGFKAFEHQLGRVGGGASLIVVVESPDRAANEHFIDQLSDSLANDMKERAACNEACKAKPDAAVCAAACGPELIGYFESGTKDVRKFFQSNKWMYVDLDELKKADDTIDHEIARQGGVGFDDDEAAPAPVNAPPATAADAGAPAGALGLDAYRENWEASAKRHDDFPTGYFATADGKRMGLRIVSTLGGLGDMGGDNLLGRVRAKVDAINLRALHPSMLVGYAGDIPNALEEKDSLITDAAWATGLAFVAVFTGIVVFFRSPWAALIIALPAIIGVGVAYSFAMAWYGHVNTTGAFLGAIILGNGINYPIVLLNRYREFRARGMEPEVARREAVLNAFRAELVGALVASIAYGSLVVTHFRGFNQFGVIGFVGMLLVWLSMIPCVPAMLVVDDWMQSKLPKWLRDKPIVNELAEARGPIMGLVARVTSRAPWAFLAAFALVAVVSLYKLPAYLRDPWEYDWSKLGSRGTAQSGAGAWSNKADEVFGGKMNIAGALMLADTPEQVPVIKAQILENDARDPKGQLVGEISTVADLLPGPVSEQTKKLAVLADIRARLSDRVIARLPEAERKRVLEMRPPEGLATIDGAQLPPLLRRRFEENDGRVGTVFYVRYKNDVSLSDGRNLLRIAASTDNVRLHDGTVVQTASRSTVFAEVIRSMERDGPLATAVSFGAVLVVVAIAASSLRGSVAVMGALLLGVLITIGGAALTDTKLNFFNFIALPITFGIGCEYPFNIFDRSRLLANDAASAVRLSGGAVALCSYTTTVGYGSMLFSDQQALQSFGRLAMTGEIACLAGALFFLPALLKLWPPAGLPATKR